MSSNINHLYVIHHQCDSEVVVKYLELLQMDDLLSFFRRFIGKIQNAIIIHTVISMLKLMLNAALYVLITGLFNVSEQITPSVRMLSFSRASVKMSQMMMREQRLSLVCFRSLQSSSAVSEAMPLPSVDKVTKTIYLSHLIHVCLGLL